MTNNPLKTYFRQPAIYVSLVSGGDFYPPGSLDLPPTGEIPIFPMTAKDEITYRTPDALLSGQAVVTVVQSCAPNIKNAWDMSSVDLDAVLIGIRIATYGHEMNFDSKCPHCGETSSRAVDLRFLLGKIKNPDFHNMLSVGDVQFFFKPMSYQQMNNNNKLQWQHRKSIQVAQTSDISEEEKMKLMGDSIIKLTDITIDAMTHSIAAVKTPESLVSDTEFIREFLYNCDKIVFEKIQERIITIRSESSIPSLDLKCESCQGEYSQDITLDMTNFFGPAS